MDTAAALHAALRHADDTPEALTSALNAAAAGAVLAPREHLICPAPGFGERVRAALPPAWAALPDALIHGVVRAYATEPGRPFTSVVELDAAIVVADEYHVHVIGHPDLIVCDVWRLPLALTQVLLAGGYADQQRLAQRVEEIMAADRRGERRALRKLQQLARDAGALMLRPLLAEPPDARGAQRIYATLRPHLSLDGTSAWAITWGLRVPAGWLPTAHRDDTVGVDLGVRNLVAWASGSDADQVGAPTLPTGHWQSRGGEPTPLEAAVIRRAQFGRRSAALDRTIREILTYWNIAIEGTHWGPLQGTPELESMSRSGVTDLAHWLSELSRITGSRVQLMSPWQGSHRCSRCGRAGSRSGRSFHCERCGHRGDADDNAAAWYRREASR